MDLFARTAAIGLYRPTPGSAIFHELSAYSAGLELLCARISAWEASLSPLTAGRDALAQRCALYEIPLPASVPLESLRQQVLVLEQGPEFPLTAVEDWLNRMGAQVTLYEGTQTRQILAQGSGFGGLCSDSTVLLRLLENTLSPGLTAVIDTDGPSWALLDARDMTAAALDAADKDWNTIERIPTNE